MPGHLRICLLFVSALFLVAPSPGAYAEPATAVVATVGAAAGYFFQRAQGPATNIGIAQHGLVAFSDNNQACREITAAYDDSVAPEATVRANDIVNVALKHVVIGRDLHVPFQVPDLLSGRIQAAIVANAFEMCPDSNCNGGYDFRPDADKEGRVVYFSNDITKDQRILSFGALPMFGPFKYAGHPVGISLHVVKLANDQSANMGPLLTSLATLGQQGGLSTEANGMLASLGANLLKGFDVRLLRYDSQLVRGDIDDRSLGLPKFRYGDYIVVRQEERSNDIDISRYHYRPGTAKLYTDELCVTEADNLTYGVIQVFKGDRVAYLKQAKLQELQQALQNLVAAPKTAATSQSLDEVLRSQAFQLDLDQLRRAPEYVGKPGQRAEDKEAFLTILKKLAASPKDGASNAGLYTAAEVERLRTALKVAFPSLTLGQRLDPQLFYESAMKSTP